MKETSLIIIEDDADTREALASLCSATEGFRVLGAFENAEDALMNGRWSECEILLTDIGLPGKSGIDVIRIISNDHPNVHSVVLTVFEDDDHVFDALRAGAAGYILKSGRPASILDAIDEVAKGGSPMTGTIARKVIASFKEKEKELHSEELTDRENQILRKLADGFRYKEIADVFGVSTETIRTHIRNIYRKLQVQSKIEAINKLRNLDR
jgi:DNA-binding NarL/FixJ family response regulator